MREAFASATGTPLCLEPARQPPILLPSLRIMAGRILALNPLARHPYRYRSPGLIQGRAGAEDRMEGVRT